MNAIVAFIFLWIKRTLNT